MPPLAGEDQVCSECEFFYRELSVEHALEMVRSVPDRVSEAVASTPPQTLRRRPGDKAWSVTEYVCHLRDVYAVYTIRLYRSRTEDRPVLEPMLNDLRARRFRYNERDVNAIIEELTATVAGFCEEAARMRAGDWERVVTRLPGEERTARWLVRQAAHEGSHHLRDVQEALQGRRG